MSGEEGGRPKRAGVRVIYRECDSDDEDYETVALLKRMVAEKNLMNSKPVSTEKIPALNPLQLELRQICRLGDKEALKTFLANNPEINLDFKDPDAGSTLLTEAATKTAQFTDIVSLLVDAGADLAVRDSLGNTPLHNSVMYFPSTMKTVDLLLARRADVTIKNNMGSTPFHMSDDKDLKNVLKELKKNQKTAATGTAREKRKVKSYSNSPKLRKLVCDLNTGRVKEKKIKVCFNKPNKLSSPGLLKRKRVVEEDDEDEEERVVRTKRIRFNELDSTGSPIDPQFSDDTEDDADTDQDEQDHDEEPEVERPSCAIVDNIIDTLLEFVIGK